VSNKFGDFLSERRKNSQITLRQMARLLGISAPFLQNVESSKKNPLNIEKLNMLPEILSLSAEEKTLMFDLAGEKRGEVAPDVPDYIKGRNIVVTAIRTARDLNASEEEWQKFIDYLKSKRKKEIGDLTCCSSCK